MYKFGPDQQPCDCTIFAESFRGSVYSPTYARPTGYELNISEIRYLYTTGEFILTNNLLCTTTNEATLSLSVPKRHNTGGSFRTLITVNNAPISNSKLQIHFSDNPDDYVYWRWDNTVKSGYMGLYVDGVDVTEQPEIRQAYPASADTTLFCTVIGNADKPGLDKSVVVYGFTNGVGIDDWFDNYGPWGAGPYSNSGSFVSAYKPFVGDNTPSIFGRRSTRLDNYSNERSIIDFKFINNTGVIKEVRVIDTSFDCCNLSSDLSWSYPTGLRQPKNKYCYPLNSSYGTIYSYEAVDNGICNGSIEDYPIDHPLSSFYVSGYRRGCSVDFDSVMNPPSTLVLDIDDLADTIWDCSAYGGTATDSYCDCVSLNGSYTLYRIGPGLYQSDMYTFPCPRANGRAGHFCESTEHSYGFAAYLQLMYYDFASSKKSIDIGIAITGILMSGGLFSGDTYLGGGNAFATGIDYSLGTFDTYGHNKEVLYTFDSCDTSNVSATSIRLRTP